ncbi:MAG: hypothetical protein CVU65_14635 [Deltaproteobacteria bacterium HGW-Deltaproteobacteria-22]|nr:MAG: hypothetical protein CVU65_14635 [Deltaproteobacteria bacterium HGW-Deltaproteobacteria-22]
MKNSVLYIFLAAFTFGCNAKVKVTDSCGDNFADPEEACDGEDLRGQTCESLGYYQLEGVLSCNADCSYDFSDCGGHCGNNVVETDSGEQCDGSNLNGSSCQALNYSGGQLICNETDCTFDTSGCDSVCGNGVLETGEQCDDDGNDDDDGCNATCVIEEGWECTDTSPSVCTSLCGGGEVTGGEDCDGENLDGQTCLTLGWHGGELTCTDTCGFDLSSCEGFGRCGDGVAQTDDEDCDGADLAGNTCAGSGFTTGTISCGGDCQLNTSACTLCGNDLIETGEQCDGDQLGGQDCGLLGFTSGTLTCQDDCQYDTSACENQNCGNSIIENGEDCEGSNLNGQTCVTQGFASGTLVCNTVNCTFNYSNCNLCGNSIVDPGENCDGSDLNNQTCVTQGYTAGALSCNANCTLNTSACATCGNTAIESGEDCEGPNLAGATCISEGWFKGVLACGGDCLFDETNCSDCGNNVINTGEDCEGTNLNGGTCSTVSYPGGTLTCNSSTCEYSTTNCWSWTTVSAGNTHTCAVRSNGTVWCWGSNTSGQLGNSSTIDSQIPVQVSTISSGATMVSVGRSHSCAIVSGAIKCWGNNSYGQLGDGSTDMSTKPVAVTNMTSLVTRISAGQYHTCAVKSGSAYCWGRNANGQLGNGTTSNSSVPFGVTSMSSGISMISAGYNHTCLVKTDHSSYCWGSNTYGQLGDNSTTQRLLPVPVASGMTGGSIISAGGNHTCALTTTGAVYCWGYNSSGQLGIGNTSNRSVPTSVSSLGTGNTHIAAGGDHTCAAVYRGGAKCWGKNSDGQLGNNGLTNQTSPDDVVNDLLMTFLAGGSNHTCAIRGKYVYCWGNNFNGQLGDNTALDKKIPTMVTN